MPEQWIVWNQLHGTVHRTVINDLRPWSGGANGQLDGLTHDEIGRVSVKELVNDGYVNSFDYCIMSPDYWQKNERRLRQQFAKRLFIEGQRSRLTAELILGFTEEEDYSSDDVKEAHRIATKYAHPDTGGDHELMTAVNVARGELLEKINMRKLDDDGIPF